MDWNKLLCAKRLGLNSNGQEAEFGRSHFHKDCDRIIFSSSFRRLGKKTQVHPLAQNDHVHTRLTHSLEVANVGRTLGVKVGKKLKDKIPKDISPYEIGQIVQAACLAHDIGNPPFGHAGEEAIKNWFRQPEHISKYLSDLDDNEVDDFTHFEGNAQGFRVITKLEYNWYNGGMRLTYATLGAFLKYPWTSRETKHEKKFSAFWGERNILKDVASTLGLIKRNKLKWDRHPLAFLVEASDDICYRILDLEDAHEMGILTFNEVEDILTPLCKDDPSFDKIISSNRSNRRKISFLRGKAIGKAIDAVVEAFFHKYDVIMNGNLEGELINFCDDSVKKPLNSAKAIAPKKIFDHPRKIELEIGSYTTIGTLLSVFCQAVKERVSGKKELSYRTNRALSMMGINAPKEGDNLYDSYMKVTDYISGMTDSYATHMARQFGGIAL